MIWVGFFWFTRRKGARTTAKIKFEAAFGSANLKIGPERLFLGYLVRASDGGPPNQVNVPTVACKFQRIVHKNHPGGLRFLTFLLRAVSLASLSACGLRFVKLWSSTFVPSWFDMRMTNLHTQRHVQRTDRSAEGIWSNQGEISNMNIMY